MKTVFEGKTKNGKDIIIPLSNIDHLWSDSEAGQADIHTDAGVLYTISMEDYAELKNQLECYYSAGLIRRVRSR